METIEAPLLTLLVKDSFSWIPEANQDFEQLKERMCKDPILTKPKFKKNISC